VGGKQDCEIWDDLRRSIGVVGVGRRDLPAVVMEVLNFGKEGREGRRRRTLIIGMVKDDLVGWRW
jgi:hypothetical protein